VHNQWFQVKSAVNCILPTTDTCQIPTKSGSYTTEVIRFIDLH